jgi:hypothetical protein
LDSGIVHSICAATGSLSISKSRLQSSMSCGTKDEALHLWQERGFLHFLQFATGFEEREWRKTREFIAICLPYFQVSINILPVASVVRRMSLLTLCLRHYARKDSSHPVLPRSSAFL